jgi:uncharacterized DUF497 family protein
MITAALIRSQRAVRHKSGATSSHKENTSLTYILIPPTDKSFEGDPAKGDRNYRERGLPFDLAVMLFDRPALERPDARLDYQEAQTMAIGMIGAVFLVCVYTDRRLARRIISLRPMRERRARLGLSQARFAQQFGLTLDTVQQYEQGAGDHRARPRPFYG